MKFARHAFLTPVANEPSSGGSTQRLNVSAWRDWTETSGREVKTIGERLLANFVAFRSLPSGAFEACDMRLGRVTSALLDRPP